MGSHAKEKSGIPLQRKILLTNSEKNMNNLTTKLLCKYYTNKYREKYTASEKYAIYANLVVWTLVIIGIITAM